MGFSRKLIYCLPITAFFSVTSAYSDDIITNHFSGFATLGLVSNDNSALLFRRDVTQGYGSYDRDIEWRNDSSLGLQLQTEWNYHLQTTVQFVLKDRVNDSLADALEWGFIRYRPVDGIDVRVGRMGTDIFMLSDYRQVGYAYPWVRPPHDTYALLSFYTFDGIDINKRIDLDDGTINIKAFYGKSDQKYPVGRNDNNNIHLIFEGGGLTFNWEWENWKMRYSHAKVEVENNNGSPLLDALNAVTPFWPGATQLAANFYTKSKEFKYNEFGIVYDNNSWWAQAEATTLDSNSPVIQSTRHFYVSAGPRFDNITLYAIRGYVHSVTAPVHLNPPQNYPQPLAQQLALLTSATEYAINNSLSNQHSIGLGIRWDFTTKMALKFEAEQFKIDQYGAAIWIKADPTSPAKNETANVLSLSLDMLF